MFGIEKKLPGTADVAFEDHCDLVSLVRYALDGQDMGAFLLETKSLGVSDYCFNYGFKIETKNLIRPEGAAHRFLQQWEAGIRKLSPKQKMRIYFSSFSEDYDAQAELSKLSKTDCSMESKFFIEAEKKNIRKLTETGSRQKKEILVFASYRIGSFGSDEEDC